MCLRICLSVLLLCCNVILVSSECPKYEQWQNKTTFFGGPLVCALLYGDSQCVGFPMLFGVNISSSNLGSDSSPVIDVFILSKIPHKIPHEANIDKTITQLIKNTDRNFILIKSFYANNITALVRPGCKLYLWEETNFTGRNEHSFGYKWNIEELKYRSALCECTVDDPDLLKCEMHEQWKLRNFCDFRESDIGGSCSFTLEHSYIEETSDNETNVVRNVTITETMSDMFAEKMIESFGERRMFSFLNANRSDTSTHTVMVDPRSAVSVKQRSYVCGKYHLFSPETATKLDISYVRDKWIYNSRFNTHYLFSSETQTYEAAGSKCMQLGGRLAHFISLETGGYSLRKWLARFMIPSTKWWASIESTTTQSWDEYAEEYRVTSSHTCWVLQFISKNDGFGFEEDAKSTCNEQHLNYICAKNLDI